uniref:Uncharacterized protein n=1 Tax=Brassica oleracea TaxID=3712 RepID=A0A3P6C9S2_BRAOL|nr:unnamed protein product [Brassica oleracea]
MAVDSKEGRMRSDNMVEILKSKCRRACSRSVAKLESLLSIVGGVCGEPKTSSTTVRKPPSLRLCFLIVHGDSVVVSDVEGKKRETRGLGCHSEWWLTAAALRSLKAAWFCY